jgi:hypothetical protein
MYRIRVFQPDGTHEILPTGEDRLIDATTVARKLYLTQPSCRTEVIDSHGTILQQYPRQPNPTQ